MSQFVNKTFFIRKSFFGAILNKIYSLHIIKEIFLLGYSYQLINLKKNFLICNLLKIGIMSGCWLAIMFFKYFKKLVYLLLPSKHIKIYSVYQRAILGRNDNVFIKRQYFKLYKHKYKKVTVRGIAKNPVDHPNGGRSNTKQPFKTPWGTIAKNNK